MKKFLLGLMIINMFERIVMALIKNSSLKSLVEEVVYNKVSKVLYGEAPTPRRNIFDQTTRSWDRYDAGSRRYCEQGRFSLGHVMSDLTTKEAANLRETCNELLDKYGAVSIGDVKRLCGETIFYSDSFLGWKNLSGTKQYRTLGSDKVTVTFPQPIDLR